jgi:hypothetical protein
MIYSALILNSTSKVVINRIQIDDTEPLNLPSGVELSSRHDGDIGWTLLPNNEWYNPNPPVLWTNAQKIRNIRNFRLKQSDKYVIPDFPITPEKKQEWSMYRQELRDITSQSTFPDSVIWPTKPE